MVPAATCRWPLLQNHSWCWLCTDCEWDNEMVKENKFDIGPSFYEVRLTRDFRTDHAVMIMTRKQFDFPGPPAIYKRCWKQVDWPWVYNELKRWRSVLEGFLHIPGVDEHVEKLTALINYILDIRCASSFRIPPPGGQSRETLKLQSQSQFRQTLHPRNVN